MKKYSIGVDYGTRSGRAVLVDIETGEEVATSVFEYPDGVISEKLPIEEEISLGTDWALENPADYLGVLYNTVPAVLEDSGVDPEAVIGLGIDFTSCTLLAIDKNGDPLCFKDEFRANPHSWVKLWKHHAAQSYANKLNEIAEDRGEDFLKRYGGKISSEWLIPKVWQIFEEAPDIYEAADRFIDAADWIVLKLTGQEKRSIATTGYKAMWSKETEYPDQEFLKALDPGLENLVEDKLAANIYDLGTKAGNLTPEMAEKLGLSRDVSVAVGNVDSFVAVPAVGVSVPGKMVMVMGTSICHLIIDENEHFVPGMTGCIKDGTLPGFYGYEAGQTAVGDVFEWFTRTSVPGYIHDEAEKEGLNVFAYLDKLAAELKPGESGLLALDWWNGNRSILVDADLTGLIMGMNLNTRPAEIYRALIEATAFGTNKIIKTFEENGVKIDELYTCGGLAQKSDVLMQIYADVTGKTMRVAESKQTPALGSAMFGAVAAGSENGGYDTIGEASKKMAHLKDKVYKPISANQIIYERLFTEYERLHDYFGRGENDVMKRLKEIKQDVE